MANEFKIRKGLIVEGATGTLVDVQGSNGQLFSVTNSLTGSIFAVSDISGIPIFDVNSSGISYFDGNVGIGIVNSAYPLDISSDTSTSITYQRTGVSANKWGFHSDNDATYWQNITSGNLLFTLKNSGNVGIGTTSPTSNLEIGPNGSLGVVTNQKVLLNLDGGYATTGVGASGQYKVAGFVGTTRDVTDITAQTSGEVEKNFYAGIIGGDYFNVNRFSVWQGGSERLTIQGYGTDEGNVGIGTSSPMAKSHVRESNGSYPDDANNHLVVESSGHSYIGIGGGTASDVGIHFGDSGGIGLGRLAYKNSDNSMQFSTSGSVKMVIESGGDVGIGNTNPDTQLDVSKSESANLISRVYNTATNVGSSAVMRMASASNVANSTRIEFSDSQYYTSTISGDRVQGIVFRTSATGASATGIPERMRIDPSGDISMDGLVLANQSNLYNNTTPGITSFGNKAMDASVTYYDIGKNVSTSARGVVWTGKHYIVTEHSNFKAIFYDNNFDPIPNSNGDYFVTLPVISGFTSPHGAAWDGRYLYCVLYNGTNVRIAGYDIDNGTSTATIIMESPNFNTGNYSYGLEYAEGHFYTAIAGAVHIYKLEGKTITHVSTSADILDGIEAQGVTYDGSYIWMTQNGSAVYKVNLDGTLEEKITTGVTPNNVGWAWNGENIVSINYQTGDVYLLNTTLKRIDSEITALMGGKVGVGIDAPLTALHIEADEGLPILKITKGGQNIVNLGTGSSGTGDDDTILQMFDEGIEKVRLFTVGDSWLNGGNVGIGDTSPSYKLSVVGSGSMFSLANTSTGADQYAQMKFTAGSKNNYIWTNNENSTGFYGGDGALNIYTGQVGSPIWFFTEANSAPKVVIEALGNVGIGTSAPNNTLDVSGTVEASAFGNRGGNMSRIYAPHGAVYNGSSAQTGYLIVKLPDNGVNGVNNMMTGVIRVFDYTWGESFDVHFAGYWYSGYNWTNCSAWIDSEVVDRNFSVRFGLEGTSRPVITIGETGSTWSYCKFSVINYQAGHSNQGLEKWDDGWDTAISPTFPGNVDDNVTNTQANNWKRNGQDLYYGGGTGNVGIGITAPKTKLNIAGSSAEGGGVLTLENTTTATGNADYVGKIQFYGNDSGANASGIRASIAADIRGYNGETDLVFSTAPASSVESVVMRINNGGNVSIGNQNNTYKLDVSGTIRATGDVIAYSDARVKDNVETIENALDKVIKLRGVSYTRNDVEDKTTKIGVIAQEVLEVLPEVVQQDDEGKYSVAYGNMVGLLIESIKELKAEVDELKSRL